jgi:NAD(P)-dependent dehydrogenase (short-subunit alcohol dehydrogenase family)
MTESLKGKHAVITGGTGALGTAVVTALRERGATCHVPVHDPAEIARFPLRDAPDVHLTEGVDLRDEGAVERYFASLPGVYASVHLAGGFAMGDVVDTRLEALDGLLRLNVHTTFLACREAARRMRASGEGGRIVNVAARPALVPTTGMAAYAASKAAVASLSVSLAEELAADRIWVNAIVPSTMDTPANRRSMPDADFAAWPKVEEVAATIAFLASPDNGCTRGALVTVYGRS